MEKKSKLLLTSVFFLLIAFIAILIMSYFIYKLSNDKNTAENEINNLTSEINNLQNNSNLMKQKLDAIANIINSNNIVETNTVDININNDGNNSTSTIETNTNSNTASSQDNIDTKAHIEDNQITSMPNNYSSNGSKTVKYEFSSIDKTPSGEHRILKVFEINESELHFSYSNGIDFTTRSPNRVINSIAKANSEHLYEFEEEISGHKYKLVFKFSRNKGFCRNNRI